MNNSRRFPKGRRRLPVALLPLLLLLCTVAPALAVDGVIELNQANSFGGTHFINASGSYRLTSNLQAGPGNDGIVIFVGNVTLDLNGFSVIGGGGAIADGISVQGVNTEIRNGTVRSFTRHGVFAPIGGTFVRVIGVKAIGNAISGIELQDVGNTVDGCTATGNQVGIRTWDGSIIMNSVARQNSALGLVMTATTGYRSNVVTENNGSNLNPQTTATGIQLGSNLCGTDLVCP